MLSSEKKQTIDVFEIDSPKFSITPSPLNLESSLKNAGIQYALVADYHITFAGKAFHSDIPFMIGIHFNPSKVKYIEIYRMPEYCQSKKYDINASFIELSNILKQQYGMPTVTTSASIGSNPCELFLTHHYAINHFIRERFGLEERIHINFYQRA
ncbi:MAG: hypothetical protein HFF09_02790 [Oscillospiraceae bacterium]|nr:hypothetical protein [Oscillospiraceae bacterium]